MGNCRHEPGPTHSRECTAQIEACAGHSVAVVTVFFSYADIQLVVRGSRLFRVIKQYQIWLAGKSQIFMTPSQPENDTS